MLARALQLRKQAELSRAKNKKFGNFPPPHPKQALFLNSKAEVVVFGGGAGPGKTAAVIFDAAKHIDDPNYSAVILRRTYPEITNEGGLWDEARRWYPIKGGVEHQTRLEWTFPSGATIRFSHLQHEKNVSNWQGAQLPYIAFDEVTHFTKKQFFYLLSRLRSPYGFPPRMRATCNPDADSWVAQLVDWWIGDNGYPIPERTGKIRYFIVLDDIIIWGETKQELEKKYPGCLPKSFTFIGATINDNPTLLAADPGYKANLQAQNSVDRDRLLYGNWHVKKAESMLFDVTAVDECAIGSYARPVHNRRYLWGIDPNYGGDDSFVAQAWDISSLPYSLAYEYRKNRTPATTSIRAIMPFIRRYPPLIIGIEINSGGKVIAENLAEKMPDIRIQGILSTNSSKIINTDRISLFVEERAINYPKDWAGRDEMKKFSKDTRRAIADHDDCVMAMASAFACLDLVHTRDTIAPSVGEQFNHPTF